MFNKQIGLDTGGTAVSAAALSPFTGPTISWRWNYRNLPSEGLGKVR
jgi:hypothetical protein